MIIHIGTDNMILSAIAAALVCISCSSDTSPPPEPAPSCIAVDEGPFAPIVEEMTDEVCASKLLTIDDSGRVDHCRIFEALPSGSTCGSARQTFCDEFGAALATALPDHANDTFCVIPQLDGDALRACQYDVAAPSVVGWCMIDIEGGVGNADLVADCPETQKRRFRFTGTDTPAPGAPFFIHCESETE
jgi:hypothetical protein